MKNTLGTVSAFVFLSFAISACSGVTAESDADDDGLTDKLELALRTSPNTADSDSDGALDGVEFENGTDPLAQDTDGNGVADGDEDHDRNGMPERKQRAARLHGSDEAPHAANNGGAGNRGAKATEGRSLAGCPGREGSMQDAADMDDARQTAPASSGAREQTAAPASSGEVGRDFASESKGETVRGAPAGSAETASDAAPASNGEAARGAARPASSGNLQQGPAPLSSGTTGQAAAPASSGAHERVAAPPADDAAATDESATDVANG